MINRNNIKALERNFFAVCRYWGDLKHALLQVTSLGAMSLGIDIADVNWAWNEKPLNKHSAQFVEQIKCFYRKLEVPFWWWVYPCGQSAATKQILRDAGFREIQKMSCMTATLTRVKDIFSPSADIKIKKVSSARERIVWENTCFVGFEMPPTAKKNFHSFVSSFDLRENSAQRLYLAYWKDTPVTTSLLFTYKDTAGMYYVSTIPEHRNRGFCLALIKEILKEAKILGISRVILQATTEGLGVYKKAGFTEVTKADIYSL
ncbi:MAG TPA: GNAT family N-acetyltransferase [Smithella sp.]|nr:GNAT family N-acetyltransferase [Smithella sp.]